MFNKKIALVTLAIISMLSISAFAQTDDAHGFQLSLITPVQIVNQEQSVTGLRINLIYGSNKSVTGVDWGLINRTTGDGSMGAQFGLVGIANSNYSGFQDNFFNVVQGEVHGSQMGVVNYAHYAHGFQFGLINYAATMKGLQLGLINIIGQGGTFPIFPIVNWSF